MSIAYILALSAIWLLPDGSVPMPNTSRPLATVAPNNGNEGRWMTVPLLLTAKCFSGFWVCCVCGMADGAQLAVLVASVHL